MTLPGGRAAMRCLWGSGKGFVTPPLAHYSHNPRVARLGGCRFWLLHGVGVHCWGTLNRPAGNAGLISNASIFEAAAGRSLPLNDTPYAVGIVMPSTVA